MRCDLCKWWLTLHETQLSGIDGSPAHADDLQGACKRHPPTYDSSWLSECIIEGNDRPGFSYEDYRYWNHPVTEASNWCGEFKQDHAKTPI